MRLSQKWIDKLSKLPETRMGCQVVDVYLKNGSVLWELLVVNCEEIINLKHLSFSENDIQDIKLH